MQLATQRRFKLLFTREIASCNTSSLPNNLTAGHKTTCICLQFYRSLKYLFHPNLHCKLQGKIASCDSALSHCFCNRPFVFMFVFSQLTMLGTVEFYRYILHILPRQFCTNFLSIFVYFLLRFYCNKKEEKKSVLTDSLF